ncbi:Low-density lipoprotein receptor repeat class B [Operophtera brumata]|uniref:Protein cueball n=1 Tax=Operophtera brumata TaxID=104452 RepID=A0A0L7L0I0_OPEBR|nr:Low-density lipoprotein receptor repeat class B [Operophtera brumata]
MYPYNNKCFYLVPDLAVTTGNHLEIFTNNTKISNVETRYTDLTALAYDAVYNMLLFVDRQNDNASIFSYHLATKKYQPLVRKRSSEGIHAIAFDPINSLLFWTDTLENSIFWKSLKPGSNDSAYGNLWIKMDDEIPRGIAVDSCRGYVYWTNVNITQPTIERARFDGSERAVIVSTDIYMPVSLAIDQRTKRLYWADDREGIHFSIESSDLDGKRDYTNKLYQGSGHYPNALTVSNDSLYWVDLGYNTVWKLPKNNYGNTEPTNYITFTNEYHDGKNDPFSVVANYLIQDQTEGIPECKGLSGLSQNKSAISDSFSVPPNVGLFCVHGVKVKLQCICTPGYIGDRCDISVCQNFCFQGDCSITTNGKPSCRCKEGFSGERCEVNACTGFCLNYGACYLNEEHKPVCSCPTDFEGMRCEAEKALLTTIDPTAVRVKPTEAGPPLAEKSCKLVDFCSYLF